MLREQNDADTRFRVEPSSSFLPRRTHGVLSENLAAAPSVS
jgi:hypothetical protein